MPKKHILFLILEYGELPEILKLSRILKTRDNYQISIWFVKKYYNNLAADTEAVLKIADCWIDSEGKRHQSPSPPKDIFFLSQKKKRTVSSEQKPKPFPFKLLMVGLINSYAKIKAFYKRKKQVEYIIKQLKPDALIVGQDSLGKELSFALQAAKAQYITTLIAPFAMFNREELLYYALGNQYLHVSHNILNKIVSYIFPRWCASVDGVKVLRERSETIIALEILALCNADPWAPCTEPVDYIFCDSDVTLKNYIDLGIEKEKIIMLGSAAIDKINQTTADQQQQWKKSLNLNIDAPLLLCGWPVNMFPWLGERTCDFKDYQQVAAFWCDMLQEIKNKFGWEIVLSIHPKTLDEEIALAMSYGFTYVRGNVETIIASCDMFTTLNGSSITAWALSARKPCILFDCFNTQYKDFNKMKGCEIYENAQAFQERIFTLCDSEMERLALQPSIYQLTDNNSKIDSNYEDRVLKFFDSTFNKSE